jgi:hypothetical protein
MPTTTWTPQTVSTIGARVRPRLYMTRRFPGLDGRVGTVAGRWDDDLYVAWDGLPGGGDDEGEPPDAGRPPRPDPLTSPAHQRTPPAPRVGCVASGWPSPRPTWPARCGPSWPRPASTRTRPAGRRRPPDDPRRGSQRD